MTRPQLRLPLVPSGITGDLGRYLGQVVQRLNQEGYVSQFSNAAGNPNSLVTGIPGNLTVWVSGSTGSQRLWAKGGTGLNDDNWYPAGTTAGSFSGCRVSGTGTQTLVTGTPSYMTWNINEYDVSNYHSANTSRLVAPVAGYYRMWTFLKIGRNATGSRFAEIFKNGSTTTFLAANSQMAVSTDRTEPSCYGEAHLDAGDFIEARGYQDSGSNLTVDRQASAFGMSLIAAD